MEASEIGIQSNADEEIDDGEMTEGSTAEEETDEEAQSAAERLIDENSHSDIDQEIQSDIDSDPDTTRGEASTSYGEEEQQIEDGFESERGVDDEESMTTGVKTTRSPESPAAWPPVPGDPNWSAYAAYQDRLHAQMDANEKAAKDKEYKRVMKRLRNIDDDGSGEYGSRKRNTGRRRSNVKNTKRQ